MTVGIVAVVAVGGDCAVAVVVGNDCGDDDSWTTDA